MSLLRRFRVLILSAAALGVVAAAALVMLFSDEIFPESSPAERGFRVAQSAGCFSCHGSGGESGAPNPSLGRASQEYSTIPSLFGERHSIEELRQWIENGISDAKTQSRAYMDSREREAIKMPAFKDRLSASQIDDLITYLSLHQYRSEAGSRNDLPEGERLAREYGCFTCHGEMGQGGVGNSRSLKGYIPGFFGGDFLALTQGGNRGQVLEWIRDGAPEAFLQQGFLGIRPAEYIMQRQAIQMPAYKDHMSQHELEALTDFVLELHSLGPLSAAELQAYRPKSASDAPPVDEGQPAAAPAEGGQGGSQSLFLQVRGILSKNCLKCHGSKDQKSEYRLDRRDSAIRGGEIAQFLESAAIEPGDAQSSLLIKFVEAIEEDLDNEIYPMPPEGKRLTAEEIELLRRWIDQGLLWPEGMPLAPTNN